MIKPSENQKYLEYANILFSYFKGCDAGQGCFLMRIMREHYTRLEQRRVFNCLTKVLFNLCVNGYLEVKNPSDFPNGWINITEKGVDYLRGGPLVVNKVDFTQYIDPDNPVDIQYDDLWELIGEKDFAPFYISGPTFLNMIRPYLNDYVCDYMTYINSRRKNEQSTSRRIWYKDLYRMIIPGKLADFLSDLSYAVSLSYYYPDANDDDYEGAFNERLELVDTAFRNEFPQLPELQITDDNKRQTPEELLAIVIQICQAYKSLIENNRMYRLLYNDDGTAKDETAAQLLFYCVAQSYCKQFNVDLNRECDPGIGEMDFKLSVGCSSKVIIEMKLSSNRKLLRGFEKQLPAYLRAEEAKYGIYLVLQLNATPEPQLEKIQTLYESMKNNRDDSIKLICIDAVQRQSASKL